MHAEDQDVGRDVEHLLAFRSGPEFYFSKTRSGLIRPRIALNRDVLQIGRFAMTREAFMEIHQRWEVHLRESVGMVVQEGDVR